MTDDKEPVRYSPTGMCPECGCELNEETSEEWIGDYENMYIVRTVQSCPCCSYESDPLYDD